MLKTITSVANTVGALEYKGLWNAATNTPTLVSSVGTQGDYYVVSVAGTTNLDGVTTWDEGDWAIFNGSVWQLFQGGQDGVFATLTVSGEIAANGGIDVTGTLTATGAEIGTTSDAYSAIFIISSVTGESELRMGDTDTDAGSISYTNSNDTMTFRAAAASRLTINSTGIDVTGTATMDGLTVGGSGVQVNLLSTNASENYLYMKNTEGSAYIGQDAGALQFYSGGNTGGVGSEVALKIDGNNDISFYEDTGTTPKFFWDASAESLGIGTTSPTQQLHIKGSAPFARLESTSTSYNGFNALNDSGNFYFGIDDSGGTFYGSSYARAIYADGAYPVTFYTDAVERMRIDSNGVLQSNGYSVVASSARPASGTLRLGNLPSTSMLLDYDDQGQTIATVRNQYGSLSDAAELSLDSGFITFNTGASFTERMKLDASGKLTYGGISYGVAIDPDGSGGFGAGYNFETNGGSPRHLVTGPVSGQYLSSGASPHIAWYAGASAGAGTPAQERARLTSDGDFLVGTTDPDVHIGTASGAVITSEGFGFFAVSGNAPIYANRLTSDGAIIDLRKNGTSVGSIGTRANLLKIGTGDVGLLFNSSSDAILPENIDGGGGRDAAIDLGVAGARFKDLYLSGGTIVGGRTTFGSSGFWDASGTGNNKGLRVGGAGLYPTNGTGAALDSTLDIGTAVARFRDLYLSGGVYLGGTGAANLLNDYEEGTWNGVITDGTNNATMADTECFYTKTGRLVTLSGDISTSALGSVAGSSIRISGVPFSNGAKGVSAAIGRASNLAITAGYIPTLYFDASSAVMRLGLFDNAGGTTTLQATEWTDDGQISFSITYTTA